MALSLSMFLALLFSACGKKDAATRPHDSSEYSQQAVMSAFRAENLELYELLKLQGVSGVEAILAPADGTPEYSSFFVFLFGTTEERVAFQEGRKKLRGIPATLHMGEESEQENILVFEDERITASVHEDVVNALARLGRGARSSRSAS